MEKFILVPGESRLRGDQTSASRGDDCCEGWPGRAMTAGGLLDWTKSMVSGSIGFCHSKFKNVVCWGMCLVSGLSFSSIQSSLSLRRLIVTTDSSHTSGASMGELEGFLHGYQSPVSMTSSGNGFVTTHLAVLDVLLFREAFDAARCARLLTAAVSFRKTKSNSSGYPEHSRFDLMHWLQQGRTSSHCNPPSACCMLT